MDNENKDDQLYVYKLFGISTPRLIKARSSLRQKIGPVATISEAQILKAQFLVDQTKVNFEPYIMDHISAIADLVEFMREDNYSREDHYNRVVVPIVQIKGQAAMFGNPVATIISEKLLAFMEQYKRLDDDVLDILTMYCKVVAATCHRDVADKSDALIEEMDKALSRYVVKFKNNTKL